jgi:UPF0042 nucleotide-binding protein
VDNLPLPLLEVFLGNPAGMVEGRDRIAVVADVRAPGLAERLPVALTAIDRQQVEVTLLFLDASDEALLRRFSETRRPHPMAGEGEPLVDSIRRERELLGELRARADMVVDTTDYSVHEVRRLIYREFSEGPDLEPKMFVSLVSFGFKYGIPPGSDLVFDVRYLPNPHFVPGLREQTGRDQPVQDYLDDQPDFPELLDRLSDLLLYLLPRYRQENRSYLTVAVGCTGGRHRSVAVSERLQERLRTAGWSVRVVHRDADREA